MILRLWRAQLRPGAESELLARLRDLVTSSPATGARPVAFSYGFRHEGGSTSFLSLSVWADFAGLLEATGGDLGSPIRWVAIDDLCESTEATTLEALPPEPTGVELQAGRVLGVVTGSVHRNHEALAQEMIDRGVAAALAAGALAGYAGRRMNEGTADIGVVVIWPDRATLGRFVRARTVGAIDPQFTTHLIDWRFETYDAIPPDRLVVPPAGPAVLLADQAGRLVDASPGIERVLGVPGELLLGRSVTDLAVDVAAERWGQFDADGEQSGEVDLRGRNARPVHVRYRRQANLPAPGLQVSVLDLPGDRPDPRSVEQIAVEVFPRALAGNGRRPGGAE